MNIFLSLSERMCLMKAQPVPMRAIVMNRRAPFSLKEKQIVQGDYFVLLSRSSLLQTAKPQTQINALLFVSLASAYPTRVKQMYLLTTVHHTATLPFIHNCQYKQSFPEGVIHLPS